MLTGGSILDLDAAGAVLEGHAIVIVGTDIVEVCPAADIERRWSPQRTIDADGAVVCPGFVDAHVHLSALLGSGRRYAKATGPGLFAGASRIAEITTMMNQLMTIPVPDEVMSRVAAAGFVAMIRSGITSVVDAGSTAHAGLVAAVSRVGIRAAIGPALADTTLDADGALRRHADTSGIVDDARRFVDEHDGAAGGLVRALVAAADPISCSDELLAAVAGLAADRDIPTHVHSHVSAPSALAHAVAFGRSETDRLAAAGLLSPRCVAMHVGHVDDRDLHAFVTSGVTVNHNPLGNAMLGFGTAADGSLARLRAAGVPVVLGSDYTPSMIATPFDIMRAALTVSREVAASDDGLTLEDAVAMATNSGVATGHPGRLGRIAAGQLADLVVIDTTGAHHLGRRHPIPAVALRARPSDVRTVIINGRTVFDDHQFLDLDEAQIIAEADLTLASM
jgi:5-methylthioadenosine/S-adenosylhomocysteine deaminase